MERVKVFTAAVFSAAIGAMILVGTVGAKGASSRDFVAGTASVPLPDFPAPGDTTVETITVSAQVGKKGPKGVILFESPISSIPVAKATVTCVSVVGDLAIVGGTFKTPFTYLGATVNQFAVVIQDGSPDAIHPLPFRDVTRPPGFQPCNTEVRSVFPVSSGNYVVHDGDGT